MAFVNITSDKDLNANIDEKYFVNDKRVVVMADTLWEDKEVRFDVPLSQLKMKAGEAVLDRLEPIEDTKGNGGDKGRLVVSNLRVIWHSLALPRINLSVGFNTIVNVSTKTVNSQLRGTTDALHILTKSNNTRFEFIFTNLVVGSLRHFTSVMEVHKAYNSSRMYRELKLRGAIVHNKQLKMLPLEQVYKTVTGVWNLSSDQGNLGTFFLTNVRLVWFADMNESFNISLPYLQMKNVRVRESKFGTALVVESADCSGGYVLGFRIDPAERLQLAYKELSSLHSVYTRAPVFGVQYAQRDQVSDARPDEPSDVEDEGGEPGEGEVSGALAAYLADGGQQEPGPGREPLYDPGLGLAVERLKDGFTLRDLWEVIPGA
ncbi:Bardet-Biedl syndrome 5 protein homolog [Bacillus rossius redtenbacheri]|uniref:Bardet-Biedl syndrome 5 protein homolog n=1 Tax=Bacillus rossius redtenbacheri TaxID=93214 RepID=UPI002FDE4BD7